MKQYTQKLTNFKQGMIPNLYGNGLARLEHFNTITEQAQPFKTLSASTHASGSIVTAALKAFTRTNDVIYAIGVDISTPANPYVHKWVTSEWQGLGSFGAGGSASPVIWSYLGKIYGLKSGTHIWEMTTALAFNGTFHVLSYTTFCDPVIHSKDGLCYVFTDNKVSVFNSAGSSVQLALTLPTNFVISSGDEWGDYLVIAGFDSTTGKSTVYVWDRDISLATLSQKFEMGSEKILHVANLNRSLFIVSLRADAGNSDWSEKPSLVIRYINGERIELKNEYRFESFANNANKSGGKFSLDNRLYFAGLAKFIGDTAAKNYIFVLDEVGNLTVAQNASVNSGTSLITGIFREGESFWLAGGSDGAWNTINTFATTSVIETTRYRSGDMTKSVDFLGAVVEFEPLPAGATVVLQSRADASTTWVTLATFSVDDSVKGVITKQGCSTTPVVAKERQFRIESFGGAVITGYQIDMVEINDAAYG
jgi:hypothetical protein